MPRWLTATISLERETFRGDPPEKLTGECIDPSMGEIAFLEGSLEEFHDSRGAQSGARNCRAEGFARPDETSNDPMGRRHVDAHESSRHAEMGDVLLERGHRAEVSRPGMQRAMLRGQMRASGEVEVHEGAPRRQRRADPVPGSRDAREREPQTGFHRERCRNPDCTRVTAASASSKEKNRIVCPRPASSAARLSRAK